MKKKKSRHKRALRGSLATAVGDLEARLDLASGVHESPLVFPLFAGGVILDLPGLIKGLEPDVVLAMKTKNDEGCVE